VDKGITMFFLVALAANLSVFKKVIHKFLTIYQKKFSMFSHFLMIFCHLLFPINFWYLFKAPLDLGFVQIESL